jgi:hypothetical protein
MRRPGEKSQLVVSVCCLLFVAGPCASGAEAASRSVIARRARADAPARVGSAPQVSARAPSGPPLVSRAGGGAVEDTEAAGASSPAGEADPLVSNGLGSPSCRAGLAGELANAARRNCETSGFVGAAAPTGNYGIDVHIDTGALGFSLLSTVQGLVITPAWMAVVWTVHALIVMLEWCFALDLLNGGTLSSGLAAAQRYLTSPWLPLALSIAAVILAYEGLVRRRVAQSLGQALVSLAMVGGGLWVMLNPAGTVGALSSWSNQAGMGTLAVAIQGTPVAPAAALGVGMDGVFAATVEGPWCYLEFGDVQWCLDPSRLDRGLKEAGLKIAGEEASQSACIPGMGCAAPGAQASAAIAHSIRLLREARTNGAVFLALPSNGPARNSINNQNSLLRALCHSQEATNCTGPTAAQAEFRTSSGTWARVGGLLLIAVGVVGMLLLLGHIGLRLLMAAMLSLFYLLLAPGVVLAPALGERGRALFRAWAARLFGAIVSKLVFAFVLGVVLAVIAVIESLGGLGWWTQWLLMATFCWGVFFKRHRILSGAISVFPGSERAGTRQSRLGRRAGDMVERSWRARRARRASEQRNEGGENAKKATAGTTVRPAASVAKDPQVLSMLAQDSRGARRREDGSPGAREARRAQLSRIATALQEALAAGHVRRAAQLEARRDRVEGESGSDQAGMEARSAGDYAQFLDSQARLPGPGVGEPRDHARDYPALAALAGLEQGEYGRMGPGGQRAARLEIDRELAARRERQPVAFPHVGDRQPDDVRASSAVPRSQPPERGESRMTRPDRRAEEPESEVMRDARDVAAGRKRQLGIGRP